MIKRLEYIVSTSKAPPVVNKGRSMLMQVSGILPILLNIILSEQQNPKQSLREQDTNTTVMRPQTLSTTTPEASQTAPSRDRPAEGGEPILLPLPLKTPLFPDTQFLFFVNPMILIINKEKGRQGLYSA